jgi:hypothetical protein
MALVADVNCPNCGQTKHEVVHFSSICMDCRCKEQNRKRRVHFASLEGLTLEERIERIEIELYEMREWQKTVPKQTQYA